MVGAIATATEMKNNFGRYLDMVINGQEVIVTKNGKTVGRFIPQEQVISFITDSLVGILKGSDMPDDARRRDLYDKYNKLSD